MIGYHYTTIEHIGEILRNGLNPAPISTDHHKEFGFVLPLVKDGAIWVYAKPFIDNALIGFLMWVAMNHCCNRICCLEVEYPKDTSATVLAQLEDDENIIQLVHTLGAGHCGHEDVEIDLVVLPIPPDRIKLIDQWDFNDIINRKEIN